MGLAGQVRSSKMLNSDSAHAARLICSRCRPHLNFISGENGSGKSAALQCLQVCLGVQARLTGRARSGKELINDNAATATAKVVLWNTVGFQFAPVAHLPLPGVAHPDATTDRLCGCYCLVRRLRRRHLRNMNAWRPDAGIFRVFTVSIKYWLS